MAREQLVLLIVWFLAVAWLWWGEPRERREKDKDAAKDRAIAFILMVCGLYLSGPVLVGQDKGTTRAGQVLDLRSRARVQDRCFAPQNDDSGHA